MIPEVWLRGPLEGFDIAIGITSMVLFHRATGGVGGTAATLASLAQHATTVRLTVLLTLLTFFVAVTLYALTREAGGDMLYCSELESPFYHCCFT